MENSILDVMVNQHALLETLFSAFKDEVKENLEEAKPFLSELVWESRKHFLVEEGAIFDYLPWSDPEISGMIDHIKKEHVIMIDRLGKMQKNLSAIEGEEVEIFGRLLTGHRKFEEERLYPVLDKRLTSGQREVIIKRADEIPIKK